MVTQIVVYLSLLLQIVAMGFAISLFKRTKFNAAWILISTGFFLMAIYRAIELVPSMHRGESEELYQTKVWLSFVISLAFAIGAFYIRKVFQFLRRLDGIRSETEKRVLSAVIRTEEQERQRFAKELHDGLGPLLSVIKMLLSGFEEKNSSEVNDKIKGNLKQAVDEAITSVREISANISPHILNNFGLKDATESFIRKLRPAEGISINFKTNIDNRRFIYNVEVIMYRVICELINNTLRHANASKISIDLQLQGDVLYLEYEDNGMGFDVKQAESDGGMGLSNMQYRLNSGNGDIKISSESGRGMIARAFKSCFMDKLRIYLVDDHKLFREGLKLLLSTQDFVRHIYEASNGREFIENLSFVDCDVVLMDIEMPEMNGIDATIEAMKMKPNLKIIVLSMYGDEQYYYKMIDAGAKGFLLKNSGIDKVVTAIQKVAEGESFFSEELLVNILNNMRDNKSETPETVDNDISERELEILYHVCKGLSNQEIADELFISKRTVDKHRANLLSKTGCRNTAALVMYAIKNNIIEI